MNLNFPQGVALDASGNIYIADRTNCTIRETTSTGATTTMAGAAGSNGSSDGTGAVARFNGPGGTAVDTSGNVYVADTGNHTIRKITPAGVVTTLAGTAGMSGSADGTGAAARFNAPRGVAVDTSGNVYVADTDNCTIRKITPAGVVTTLAGTAGMSGSTNGSGTSARFSFPYGLAVDTSGYVFVADTGNQIIRNIDPNGIVYGVAGTPGKSGGIDGITSVATFNNPQGIAVDSSGIYVADTNNHTIRRIANGSVYTLAGSTGVNGSNDGSGTSARFNRPSGLAVNGSGNVFVADTYNHTIRQIAPAGTVTTLAGTLGWWGFIPGPLPGILIYPSALAISSDGDLVVPCNYGVVQITGVIP